MSRSEANVLGAVESHGWVSQVTGIKESKLRTWYARNTNGYADLFTRSDFRPPLLIKDRAEVRDWVEAHKVGG